MWLFTTIGFFSCTVSKDDPTKIQIRARERVDLDALKDVLGIGAEILETPRADYRYRVIIEPETFPRILMALAALVDYSNFKDAVKASPDQAHKVPSYLRVWATMQALQPRDGDTPGEFDLWGPDQPRPVSEGAPTIHNVEHLLNFEPIARRPAVAKGVLKNPKAKKKNQTGDVCADCGGLHKTDDCPL